MHRVANGVRLKVILGDSEEAIDRMLAEVGKSGWERMSCPTLPRRRIDSWAKSSLHSSGPDCDRTVADEGDSAGLSAAAARDLYPGDRVVQQEDSTRSEDQEVRLKRWRRKRANGELERETAPPARTADIKTTLSCVGGLEFPGPSERAAQGNLRAVDQ